jgi:hypothetical protein
VSYLAVNAQRCQSVLHMQIHELGRGHHVVVQIRHDPERAGDHQGYDEHAKRERQYVVGIVRTGRDVQEEDQRATVVVFMADCSGPEGG